MISIIGSSNVDLVIRVPKIPAIGETILGGQYSQYFGGKGANQAVAAKRAKGNIHFITKVGNDDFGKSLRSHFIQEGIPVDGILVDQSNPTGIAQIWVSDAGENSIVVASGANLNLLENDVLPFQQSLIQSEYVLMQLESPISTISKIAEWSYQAGKRVIINPAPAQTLPDNLLSNCWLLTPNETEAELLTGIRIRTQEDAIKAASILHQKGVKHVIITLGSKGCLWFHDSIAENFPTFSVKAIDTTAAGDVFNGALVVALDEGVSMPDAIGFASAAAAISVTRAGAQSSIPVRKEIETLVQTNS